MLVAPGITLTVVEFRFEKGHHIQSPNQSSREEEERTQAIFQELSLNLKPGKATFLETRDLIASREEEQPGRAGGGRHET